MVFTHGAKCIGPAAQGNFWFHTACSGAAWRDLVLLSWRVDPVLLAPHVPAGTDLDVAALTGKPNSGVNAD